MPSPPPSRQLPFAGVTTCRMLNPSSPTPAQMPPITREDLVSGYHESGKPRDRWRVGAEFERHLLLPDGSPLPYFGTPGVRWLLERLAETGWQVVREGEHPIALVREGANVTLEPGGQFELSGSPFFSVREIAAEARAFALAVERILEGTDVRQVGIGFTPTATIAEIGWVPKGRYEVMRTHLAATGDLAHHMMKGTAATQATYDYADEADCARKVRLAALLGPITTAIFANSPYVEGKRSGFASWRGHVWTRTDPSRTGFPAAAERFSFEAWVDWLLSVPMMFVRDPDGAWLPAHGRTFGEWMADPMVHPSHAPPTQDDWELHLTSVFPEVRIKRTIEVRGADCVPLPLAAGFAAMWRGLLYDERALAQATEIGQRFAACGTSAERFDAATRGGLKGEVGGRALAAWAAEVIAAAEQGLARLDPADVAVIEPVRAQVATGRSPAHDLLDASGERAVPAVLLQRGAVIG